MKYLPNTLILLLLIVFSFGVGVFSGMQTTIRVATEMELTNLKKIERLRIENKELTHEAYSWRTASNLACESAKNCIHIKTDYRVFSLKSYDEENYTQDDRKVSGR